MAPLPPSSSQQQYGKRNLFYLRVSPSIVLPCILYLDARHVAWLNAHPSVFHCTLGFLKDRILQKLDREAKVISFGESSAQRRIWSEMSGNEVVDMARKPEFHLAYFFKKSADKHAVLLKEKELLFPGAQDQSGSKGHERARKEDVHNSEEVEDSHKPVDDSAESLVDIDIKPDPELEEEANENLLGEEPIARGGGPDSEAEDVKQKFKIKVRYNGFRIFPKSLVLVVEPSPNARARSPHLFNAHQTPERRQLSVAPALIAAGSTQTRFSRPLQTPSVAPRRCTGATVDFDGHGGVGSRRDASRTPLFRESLTPSEVCAEDQVAAIGEAVSDRALMPPPGMTLSRSRGQEGQVFRAGDLKGKSSSEPADSSATNDDEIQGEEEGSLHLAERMLFSQGGIAHGAGVNDWEQGVED